MVAQGQHVHAAPQQRPRYVARDPHAPGGVLGVGDHQVGRELGLQTRRHGLHRLPARFTDHIADKEYPHWLMVEWLMADSCYLPSTINDQPSTPSTWHNLPHGSPG